MAEASLPLTNLPTLRKKSRRLFSYHATISEVTNAFLSEAFSAIVHLRSGDHGLGQLQQKSATEEKEAAKKKAAERPQLFPVSSPQDVMSAYKQQAVTVRRACR